MSLAVESPLALVEVCPDVTLAGGTVGLIAMSREGKGWTQMTPAEARQLAAVLAQAADETERRRQR